MMLKNKLFSAVSPIIKTKNDKEELFSHINECIKEHTGNPLKKSKLAKLTADIFGYDNPHILPSKLQNISLTKAIELSDPELLSWVNDIGGYRCENQIVIPLFDFNDRDNDTVYSLCFMMKFNIINHENYFLSLTTVIFDDTKNIDVCFHYGHNEINELAANSSFPNDYGHYEHADDFDNYVEEDRILREIMEVMHCRSDRDARTTKALATLTNNEFNDELQWDINELKSIYKEAAFGINRKVKEIISAHKDILILNSSIYYEKETMQYLICDSDKTSLKKSSEYEIEIEYLCDKPEIYTYACNNYREALNYAHFKLMSSFNDNSDIYKYDFYKYDNVPLSSYEDCQRYNKTISSRKIRDMEDTDFLITVTDLKDKQNKIYIELFDKHVWKLPLLTYL